MPIIAVMSWPRNKTELLKLFKSAAVDSDHQVITTVRKILADVEKYGDRGLFAWAEKLDQVKITSRNVKVKPSEIKAGYDSVDRDFLDAAKTAIERITAFHEFDGLKDWKVKTESGSVLGKITRPIGSVGICVPGKRYPLPSTLIMCAVPARIASVDRIVAVSPPGPDGAIDPRLLAVAKLLEIDTLYRIGGAQAVAALAYGTESVEPVNKIVGPGSVWTQAAKKEVFGRVGIDMIAGPSELAILADGAVAPSWAAADMLSQLEHGPSSRAFLITDSNEYISRVSKAMNKLICANSHEKVLRQAIRNSAIIKVDSLEKEGVDVINHLAPEHVQILARKTDSLVRGIRAAGAVFLGKYSPEPIGDYIAGPNHTLPTGGAAVFSSPLSVRDFQTQMSYIKITKEEFQNLAAPAEILAESESLVCHADSLKIRLSPETVGGKAEQSKGDDGDESTQAKKSRGR